MGGFEGGVFAVLANEDVGGAVDVEVGGHALKANLLKTSFARKSEWHFENCAARYKIRLFYDSRPPSDESGCFLPMLLASPRLLQYEHS